MPLSTRVMQPKVKRSIARVVARACEVADTLCDVRHRIRVLLFPTDEILVNGKPSVGCFSYDVATAEIHLAADRKPNEVLSTLAHELVHYMQWCEGDSPIDRDCENEAIDREGDIYRAINKAIRRRK